jgi:hypothetical protein
MVLPVPVLRGPAVLIPEPRLLLLIRLMRRIRVGVVLPVVIAVVLCEGHPARNGKQA